MTVGVRNGPQRSAAGVLGFVPHPNLRATGYGLVANSSWPSVDWNRQVRGKRFGRGKCPVQPSAA